MRRSHNSAPPRREQPLMGPVEIALALARSVVPAPFVYTAIEEAAEAKRAMHAGSDFVEDLACAEVCRLLHLGLTDDQWPSPSYKGDVEAIDAS